MRHSTMGLTKSFAVAQIVIGSAVNAATSKTLQPWKYTPLPLGAIKPQGWLLGETQAMADGLFGHEHDFYVYVNDSSWLHKPGSGGAEYSNLNEALPYWFNSIVPMAYTLDNDRLKGQVSEVAKTVLGWQDADGWIGPEVGESRNFWARTPFFLGLIQLAEADSSWEKQIVDSLRHFMTLANKMLKNNGQGFTNCGGGVDCSWGQARVHDLIITIQWLLEHYPSEQDSLLWDNMNMFHSLNPRKWDAWYTETTYPKVVNPDDGSIFPYIHGVNVGQGLKASSVIYRMNGDKGLIQKSHDAVDWTFEYHGSASGSVLADEKQTGLASYVGSELCTAVETSYSLAYLYQALGSNYFADKAERAIFNAMPVMMTGDKWAHQYMAQPNQPWAVDTYKDGKVPPIFTTANSGVATTFGMEPLYPCCTVNHGQGYPKFISNSWVSVGKNGLGHALLSPSSVSTKVNGGDVSIECDTSYPFDNTLTYTIKAKSNFDFYVRVPDWASGYTLVAVGSSSSSAGASSGGSNKGMQKIPIRSGNTKVTYKINAGIRTETRSADTVAVYYGNMLYALDVGYSMKSSFPHAYYDPRGPGLDYLPFKQLRDEYINNTQPWNVAIDPSTLKYHGAGNQELKDPIFEQGAPPNYMTVDGCEIKWGLYMDTTPDIAPSDRTCIGDKKTFRLVPYGAAKVHMSDLPTVKL